MGFASVENFALEKTKETLVEEIAESMRKTELFQGKYQLDYIDFCKAISFTTSTRI